MSLIACVSMVLSKALKVCRFMAIAVVFVCVALWMLGQSPPDRPADWFAEILTWIGWWTIAGWAAAACVDMAQIERGTTREA